MPKPIAATLMAAVLCAACVQRPVAPAAAAAVAGLQLAATPAQGPAAVTAPALLTLDPAALTLTRQRLESGDASLTAPFAALRKRAERALTTPPRSVTHKTSMPPSGSKHDYMSMGPYWWPNPATPNGLPFVQRDGQRNPQSAGDALDSERLQRMLADARDLALAYHFTGDARFAKQAAVVIRTWFLDPATRMNPSLRFAQSIPGIVDGRGIGIIDTRDLWLVIDALALLAPAGDGLSIGEQQALRQWFADYATWLHTSELGRDEAAEKNNHGMFFDVQLAALWLYVGETERARQLVFDVQRKRFAAQFDAAGRMPLELARTRPYHYHTFTLQASTRLARYGQALAALPQPGGRWAATDPRCQPPALDLRCPLDLWRVSIDGKSLAGVLDFVAAPVLNPKAWVHATALEPEPPLATAMPVLLAAQRALPPGRYGMALARLKALTPDHVAWLLWPLP